MATTTDYLALDLGAESGRGMLGRFDGERLGLEEMHRFPNGPVQMLDTLYWDLPRLFDEMKTAIGKTAAVKGSLDGIGVDTWGVDFGLVGRNDTLLGNPVHYRDARTEGMFDAAFKRISRDRLYEITGLQFLPFNTVYQLLALKLSGSPLLDSAETLLMMPDLLGWLLTGERAGERTDSSTTQLLDPRTGEWSDEICRALDLPRNILPRLIDPGSELGMLRKSVAAEVGVSQPLTVIAPPTHDTASAVAAVPAVGPPAAPGAPPDWCYLSSGTWSLLGVEVGQPVITPETQRYNFTNEGGVAGTTRLLKNIMGLWLVQESRRTWARAGNEMSYEQLMAMAMSSRPFTALIDPDDPSFLSHGDMPSRIAAFCKRTGQTPPDAEGPLVRTCLESLALKYRWTIERLEGIVGTKIKTIHIVGGGSKNTLLCQFAADACGRPVHGGPVEATAIGNILMQALGRGRLGSLQELRAVVARSFPVTVYEPRNTRAWDDAAGRFEQLVKD
ncbi:rhamnulokinase [Paludisphaera borealis]|uniref:L-Rhamnulokinase n=1 Tax=Paludisphaera borealis TaxID=1387353 RepID=A0A1U7CS30_9BACT|nr:rhamnulokinase family protein [Paludisphaera borealis]APW61745.1 L-Rhamnulokinase [Paludisphaera borealis]MDR3618721.1 rhamnulokinase [Paludisphaera borealis]